MYLGECNEGSPAGWWLYHLHIFLSEGELIQNSVLAGESRLSLLCMGGAFYADKSSFSEGKKCIFISDVTDL